MTHSISFLIPTYNDQTTIRDVLHDAIRVGRKCTKSFELIILNDGSTDRTAEILQKEKRRFSQLVVRTHERNLGYGKTIRELYYLAKKEWLLTIPGDRQVRADELETLLLYANVADMIVGWRKDRHDPVSRKIQSGIYNRLLRLLFGLPLHDANSVRLMRTVVLKKIELQGTSAFVDAELAIKAQKERFRIKEVPIVHWQRAGKRGGGGKWWTILPTIWEMVQYWMKNI